MSCLIYDIQNLKTKQNTSLHVRDDGIYTIFTQTKWLACLCVWHRPTQVFGTNNGIQITTSFVVEMQHISNLHEFWKRFFKEA